MKRYEWDEKVQLEPNSEDVFLEHVVTSDDREVMVELRQQLDPPGAQEIVARITAGSRRDGKIQEIYFAPVEAVQLLRALHNAVAMGQRAGMFPIESAREANEREATRLRGEALVTNGAPQSG